MLDPERWKIADELFEAALDVRPERRGAFLAERCDDPEIRAQVQRLLAGAESDSGFVTPGGAMEGLLGEALLQRGDDTADEAATPVPESIDGYRLLRRVGEGGMGEVWEAEQLGAIRRRVAVKLVKAGLCTADVIARFDAERLAVARMNQPNIARVYGGGSAENGRPYFAMEFVDGARITDHCEREGLSIRQRLQLFIQVCDGIQHAHHKGIIHRDIKPSNVLIATEDGESVPKIIDFGVARAIERGTGGAEGMTEIGQVIGTPQYMSPEQTEVGPEEIDTRTDVYSLGVLLYELLVGVRPFELKEPSSSSLIELRRQIRETDPQLPSKRVAEPRLSRQLRGDLDWIVARCLEKDPTRRYATPHELAADVRRHLDGEAVLAGPPGVGYRLGKWVRRHRWVAAAALIAVIALVAGTVVSTLQARRAIRAEREAQAEAETARQVATFLEELFEGSDPGETLGKDPRASELLAAGHARLETELKDQPQIRARLLHVIGKTQRKLDRFEDADAVLREALELREQTLGPDHVDTIASLLELALLVRDTGDYPQAEELLRSALSRVERSEAAGEPFHARVASRLGAVLADRGRNEEALPLTRLALEIRERVLGPNDHAVANSLTGLGHIHYRKSEFDLAEEYFQRSLNIREATLGEDHPDTALAMQDYAAVLGRTGREDEAEPLLVRALEIQEQVFGAEHMEIVRSLTNLAAHYGRQGRLEEGEAAMRRALEISKTTHGPNHLRLFTLYGNLGLTNKIQGDFEDAETFLNQALTLVETQSGPEDPRLPWALDRLGSLHHALGRNREAAEYYERSLSAAEEIHGVDHPRTAGAIRGLAGLALDAGDLESAEVNFRRAVDIVVTAHGENYPNLGTQLEGLGDTLCRAGRVAEGREFLERALALREQPGSDHPGVTRVLTLLARVAREAGNLDESATFARRALGIAEKAYGPEHLDVALSLQQLALTQAASGELAAATASARRAVAIRSTRLPQGHALIRESSAALQRLEQGTTDSSR